jgi:Leucine-rich repeat (LRR) protein
MNKALAGIVGLCALGLGLYAGNRAMNSEKPAEQAVFEPATPQTEPKQATPEIPLEDQMKVIEKIRMQEQARVGCIVEDQKVIRLSLQDYGAENLDLTGLDYLTSLSIISSKTKNIVLPNAADLTEAAIYGNSQLSNIENLNRLKKIKKLHLNANNLSEIDLTGLEHLEQLLINHNKLSEIRGLETAYALAELYAHSNRLQAIPDLSHLRHLKRFWVQNNMISDYGSLRELERKGVDARWIYDDFPEPRQARPLNEEEKEGKEIF